MWGMVIGGRVLLMGAFFPCVGEFDVVVCCCGLNGGGVYASLVVSSSTLVSSCGVRRFIVGQLWLCMHIIDMRDVSTYW